MTWETSYPVELIESILQVKGTTYLCDEIRRDEDPSYVQRHLNFTILGYVEEADVANKRLLDLGSGCGSSTVNLARMFPQTEIVGVELVADFVAIAEQRARHYGMAHLSFVHSPDGLGLPEGIGQFDFIVLSAVYEHLLPHERQSLLPLIWSHLRPDGVLFINQLPHRFSPIEGHTTGLPFINYLPDPWTGAIARRLSPRISDADTWEDLLRAGIRGGTVSEILSLLEPAAGSASLLEPTRLDLNDRIDLWYSLSSGARWPLIKRAIRSLLKLFSRITNVTFVPELSLAIQKQGS